MSTQRGTSISDRPYEAGCKTRIAKAFAFFVHPTTPRSGGTEERHSTLVFLLFIEKFGSETFLL